MTWSNLKMVILLSLPDNSCIVSKLSETATILCTSFTIFNLVGMVLPKFGAAQCGQLTNAWPHNVCVCGGGVTCATVPMSTVVGYTFIVRSDNYRAICERRDTNAIYISTFMCEPSVRAISNRPARCVIAHSARHWSILSTSHAVYPSVCYHRPMNSYDHSTF